jgi:polysaccharide export outer membrane protein
MKEVLIAIFLSILLVSSVYSEEDIADSDKQTTNPGSTWDIPELEDKKKLLLSLSASDYPVTPGDVYRITYITADSEVSYEIVVKNDYIVNLVIFGKIDARNLNFPEFRDLIEKRVSKAYPDSTPSVTILSNGQFQVYVKGEVKEATHVTGWGLTRLSQFVDGLLTEYSSVRDVEVRSLDGTLKIYDLFRAKRFGELQHDPYLRPGDTVIFQEKKRQIRLEGAVKRNGIYQLLDDEGLRELIEDFGGGFTPTADPSRIRLERIVTGGSKIAESFVIDLRKGYKDQVLLMDYDRIVVPQKIEYLPVVFIEGAIQTDVQDANRNNNNYISQSQMETVPIKEGDSLYNLLWERKDQIEPTADLSNAFVERPSTGEVIPVDLQTLLYEYSTKDDIVLMPYDRVIIPFRQFLVLVTGAVYDPGQYSYVPHKTYSYYLDMAGGVNPQLGTTRGVKVTDRNGRQILKESYLEPEAHVYVPYSFSYYFLKYFPIVVSSAVVIYNLAQVLEIYGVVP